MFFPLDYTVSETEEDEEEEEEVIGLEMNQGLTHEVRSIYQGCL